VSESISFQVARACLCCVLISHFVEVEFSVFSKQCYRIFQCSQSNVATTWLICLIGDLVNLLCCSVLFRFNMRRVVAFGSLFLWWNVCGLKQCARFVTDECIMCCHHEPVAEEVTTQVALVVWRRMHRSFFFFLKHFSCKELYYQLKLFSFLPTKNFRSYDAHKQWVIHDKNKALPVMVQSSLNCPKCRSHYDVYGLYYYCFFLFLLQWILWPSWYLMILSRYYSLSEIIVLLQILHHQWDNWSYNSWS